MTSSPRLGFSALTIALTTGTALIQSDCSKAMFTRLKARVAIAVPVGIAHLIVIPAKKEAKLIQTMAFHSRK